MTLHLHDVTFALNGSEWSPSVIDELGDVLCKFQDVSSTFKTDSSPCSLWPLNITVPLNSTPPTSCPCRIKPILAEKTDAVLDQ